MKKHKNKPKKKNVKSKKEKIIDNIIGYLAVIIVFGIIFLYIAVSDSSVKASYWMGLMLRIVVFGLMLASIVLPKLIDVVHNKISLINKSNLMKSPIIIFILYILIALYYNVIPYIQDAPIAFSGNYAVIENASIVRWNWKYTYANRRYVKSGVIVNVKNKNGKEVEITFNNTNIKFKEEEKLRIEYLPHTMFGMNIKIE